EHVEPLVALLDAGLHPGRDHRVARLDALEDRVDAERGPAVPFIERQRIERHVAGRAVELEGLDDALRRGIAVEHAVEAVLAAILVPLDEAPRPAVADGVANDPRGPPALPAPLC